MSLLPYSFNGSSPFGVLSPWARPGELFGDLDNLDYQMQRQMHQMDRAINRDFRHLNRVMRREGLADLGRSEIKNTRDAFEVDLDVSHFKPEELTVRVEGNQLNIEGNHEERAEQDGSYISRRFTRKYLLPEDVNPANVTSTLANGVLVMQAPKKALPAAGVARQIPIAPRGEIGK